MTASGEDPQAEFRPLALLSWTAFCEHSRRMRKGWNVLSGVPFTVIGISSDLYPSPPPSFWSIVSLIGSINICF